jgi:hypothetical protein
MKGRLVKIEDFWMVAYLNSEGYHMIQLHPDDAEFIAVERYIDDVEFHIVEHQKLTGKIRYAKISQ